MMLGKKEIKGRRRVIMLAEKFGLDVNGVIEETADPGNVEAVTIRDLYAARGTK